MARLTLAEEGLETVFGIQDQHLKRLERAFGVRIAARGNTLSVDGEPSAVAVVEKLLAELSELGAQGFRLPLELPGRYSNNRRLPYWPWLVSCVALPCSGRQTGWLHYADAGRP